MKPEVENNLIKMLSESQGDPAVDRELRCLAISQLYPLIRDMLAPENLVRVATWIFGEYGHLSKDPSLAEIVDALAAIWHRPALSIETKSYLLSAFMKISAQTQTIPTIASVMVRECVRSHDTELVQQAMEFREMCKSGADVFLAAIPTKAEPSLFIDSELHFLDSYVMQGRLSGMKDYEEHDLSDEEDTGLKTDAYEAPPEPVPVHVPAAERKAELKEDGFLISPISVVFLACSLRLLSPNPIQPPLPCLVKRHLLLLLTSSVVWNRRDLICLEEWKSMRRVWRSHPRWNRVVRTRRE